MGNIREVQFESEAPKILSIENKETFYVLAGKLEGFDCFFYCSGRLNAADTTLLRLLNDSGAEIHHTGDLDPDGLGIFNDIDSQTGGRALPFMMDVATFNEYLDHSYALTAESIRRLLNFDNPKLNPLADEIRKTAKGLEQEIIRYL